MIYCDTSLLVSAFTNEPHGVLVQSWLGRAGDQFAISLWVETEFAAAIGRKRRMSVLSIVESAAVIRRWRSDRRSFVELPFDEVLFRRAADLALDPNIDLRSGDALHLAIAQKEGAALATLDRGLRRACDVAGVPAIDPLADDA